MGDLGWRAKSASIPRRPEAIDGLRDDFGVRVQSAVQAMRDQGANGVKQSFKVAKGKLHLQQNRGVADRAKGDFEMQETDEVKERRRLESLERKAQMYAELQARVNLDDEAANDLHEVDFIGKALSSEGDDTQSSAHTIQAHSGPSLHPEEILRRQQDIRLKMQGGKSQKEDEYSTYEQDKADLEARHKRVDETDELNAARQAEFDELKRKREGQVRQKHKEAAKQKQDILKRLLLKKQRLK